MAIYDSKYLIKWPIKNFLKQIFVDILTIVVGFFATIMITMQKSSYLAWIVLVIKMAVIWVIITVVINLIFYRSKIVDMLKKY